MPWLPSDKFFVFLRGVIVLLWNDIISFLKLCDNFRASFVARSWYLLPIRIICFLWMLFQPLYTVLTKDTCVLPLSVDENDVQLIQYTASSFLLFTKLLWRYSILQDLWNPRSWTFGKLFRRSHQRCSL